MMRNRARQKNKNVCSNSLKCHFMATSRIRIEERNEDIPMAENVEKRKEAFYSLTHLLKLCLILECVHIFSPQDLDQRVWGRVG